MLYIVCMQQKLCFICFTPFHLTMDSSKGKLTKKYIYIYTCIDNYI